ncbi:hypothetical protein, partial [Paenibacillus tundrae]|uniref:hypothetical protein n=1 Tax=Paenibacillus tundrae TaxID=528187 RepID=UPI0022A8E80E
LEVDVLDIRRITDIDKLSTQLGFKPIEEMANGDSKVSVAGLGNLANPEQLLLLYPYSLSDVAVEMGLDRWQFVNQIITKIEKDTGYKIKEETNIYHVDREQGSGRAANHRYSKEAINLFAKVRSNEKYEIVDTSGNIIGTGNNYVVLIEH